MTIRLIALDLDGTLMGHDFAIAPRVQAAVRAAQARGLFVTLATGRSYQGAAEYAAQLAIRTPLVIFQGAVVAEPDTGEPLFEITMPRALAVEAIDLARTHGWHVVIYDERDAYVDEFVLPPDFYPRLIAPYVRHVPDLRLVPFGGVTKFVMAAEPDDVPAIQRVLLEHFSDRAVIVRSHPMFVEGNPPGVSKGRALAWLAERLGVSREAVLAVGDADNDVPMLAWAGVGVAMGDASPAARAVADWIAPALADDGAAVAIERFALGLTEAPGR